MPDPVITLKNFIDASHVNDGAATLTLNKSGNLTTRRGGTAPSTEANAKALSAFMNALTKDFGPQVATAASARFRADLEGNRPLTGRTVQAVVSEAKSCIERNAMVRNGFITPDQTRTSGFDRAFEARLTPAMRNAISPELQKELKGRVMTELLEKFHSKSRDTLTVEDMQNYVAQESPLLHMAEHACAGQTEFRDVAYRNTTLDIYLDQRGMLTMTERKPPEKEASKTLPDPAPKITDPKMAFAHFMSNTAIFSGFSPAQAKQLRNELTAEFETRLKSCKNREEGKAMFIEFANNQKQSKILGILEDLSKNPCRGFPGTKDDKADIARLLFRFDDKFTMQAAMERLPDIRQIKPNGPITKEAIWQGILGSPMPKKLNVPFDEAFRKAFMAGKFDTDIRSGLLSILHNLISSKDIPSLLRNPHLPITEKNLHTMHGLSVNSVLTGTDAIVADLPRRGLKVGVPSTITVGDLKLTVGPEPKLNDQNFAFPSAADKDSYARGKHSDVSRQLSDTIHTLCGRDGSSAQREMVETLCSQSGLLPFTRMRTTLGYAITEHSPSAITIDKAADGAVRVRIATPKTIPGGPGEKDIDFEAQNGSIDVSWLVDPKGELSVEKLTIIRPGADAEQRPADGPGLEETVRGHLSQASGLNEQNRSELASLVLEAVKKDTTLRDPLNPSIHAGPLMHLVTGVRTGLFTGPDANDNYATLRRFQSQTLPVGLLLDAAAKARKAQAGKDITREALWAQMYSEYQMPDCTSDAQLVEEMEKKLTTFINDEVDKILYEKTTALRASGKPPMTQSQMDDTKSSLSRRLSDCLNSMSLAAATKFVAHPHVLQKEHLLTQNLMASFPGFQYDPRERLAQDLPRRGAQGSSAAKPAAAPGSANVSAEKSEMAIPTLSINNNTFNLGKTPTLNGKPFFENPDDHARYTSALQTPLVRRLMGEIRTLCGGQKATQAQVDTVARCCAQNGAISFRVLERMGDFKFNEHSATNVAVSAASDGNVRVHISTTPMDADNGSISFSILVDPTGHTRVDDFTAIPAGVAHPQA